MQTLHLYVSTLTKELLFSDFIPVGLPVAYLETADIPTGGL